MAKRKKRKVPAQFREPVKEETQEHAFQDEFQKTAGDRIEDFSKKFEGHGKTITYALAALAVLVLLGGIYYVWNQRSNAAAETALGRAIETSQAPVTETPPEAGAAPQQTFKTEKERAEASINEFQAVADKYGNPYQARAKYFIAVNKISLDRPAAIQELVALSSSSGDVGTLSKFALAQAYTGDGKLDEAAALYKELSEMENPILAKDTIKFALAEIYEKQDKKDEAVNLYFDIAKTASEAKIAAEEKDPEGNPAPLSQTATRAKEKVKELAPEKAKEIPESKEPSQQIGIG